MSLKIVTINTLPSVLTQIHQLYIQRFKYPVYLSLCNDNITHYYLTLNDQVTAYCNLEHHNNTVWDLCRLKDNRYKGHGILLLDLIQNQRTCTLNVFTTESKLEEYYCKWGFEIVGTADDLSVMLTRSSANHSNFLDTRQ